MGRFRVTEAFECRISLADLGIASHYNPTPRHYREKFANDIFVMLGKIANAKHFGEQVGDSIPVIYAR